MKKMFLFVLVVGVAFAVPAARRGLLSTAALSANTTVSQASNAAFRDGLYLGRFDAESGRTRHLCVGRWSSDVNRAWFTAGYQAAYQQMTARRADEE